MIDKLGRIDWNTLWMSFAFMVSQRSVDPNTKHRCVIVDENNCLLSIGYNSFPRDCCDEYLPLNRPQKYSLIIHAETNAIINAKKDLKNSIVYLTGFPCPNCFGNMLNAGIKKIIYGQINSKCVNEESFDFVNQMNIREKTISSIKGLKIKIIKYEDISKSNEIDDFLNMVLKYKNERI